MKAPWRYGDAGDRFPIQPGEVWRVGPHILACGDLMRGAAQELVGFYGVPHVTYSDPPWSGSVIKAFRTKAGLPKEPVDWGGFLDVFLGAVFRAQRSVFIEMGKDTLPDLMSRLQSPTGWVVDTWEITYAKTRPCHLVYAERGTQRLHSNPTGLDDMETPGWAISRVMSPGEMVFDPCLGLGATSRAAHLAGVHVLGLELHPRRLAVAMEWLVQATQLRPERVGTLGSMA